MINKNYKYLFLEKVVLGRKTKINNSDEVITKCISLAFDDMLTIGRFYLGENITDKNGNIKNNLKKEEKIKQLHALLADNNYQNPRQIIENGLTIFGYENEIRSEKKKEIVTRYGLCQKLVNMTFKYLYVFSDYTGINIDFSSCDCPLDSVILKRLGQTNVKWSRLTKKEYDDIQNKIKEELQKDNRYKNNKELKNIGNLAYDFLNW